MGWGRAYFAVQSLGGALWWVAVFTVPLVRDATLGSLPPVPVAVFDIPLFVGASALAAVGLRWAAILTTAWTALVAVALALFATITGEAGVGVLAMAAAVVGSLAALSLVIIGRVPTDWLAVGPFRFRPADVRAEPSSHVAATARQVAVFWSLFLGVIPAALWFLERRWGFAVQLPPASVVAGIVLFLLASALGLWAAAVMSTRGGGTPLPSATATVMVIAGPYRFVRNPMAVAGIVQGAAVGLVLSSWFVVVYAILGSLLWNYAIRPLEEADLEARFGEEFRRYRARVRCWVPRLASMRAAPRERIIDR